MLPVLFFFFNDTAPTEIYTLSLHDALPISRPVAPAARAHATAAPGVLRARRRSAGAGARGSARSEEHTSELQSLTNLVCRLLLEKKKTRLLREAHIQHSHAPAPIRSVPASG